MAFLAHRGQRRKSGEPFVIHPMQVATILAQSSMDLPSVTAGLLHDTVEDTPITFEDVEARPRPRPRHRPQPRLGLGLALTLTLT